MTAFWATAVPVFWLIMSVGFARSSYRRHLKELKDENIPAKYGRRWADDEEKRRKALAWSYVSFVSWPLELGLMFFNWLITTEHLLGVPDAKTDPWLRPEGVTQVDDLQVEIDREARRQQYEELKYGPKNELCVPTVFDDGTSYVEHTASCPCGGSPERDDTWEWKHPEPIIRTRKPERLAEHVKCGNIHTIAEMVNGDKIFQCGQGHVWEDRS